MIAALIGQPSISSPDLRHDQSNLGVIQRLAEWAENLGFRVEIDPVGPGKANLIATLGASRSADQTGGLVLSGHTDTVPCNPELWSSDPFTATERDDRIYGLGSADMKAFFALILEAAARFDIKDLQRPLVLLGTADEESSISGARQLLAQQRRLGRQAVIGEPTGLKPIRMHKGVMMESITVHGRAGHSSNPGWARTPFWACMTSSVSCWYFSRNCGTPTVTRRSKWIIRRSMPGPSTAATAPTASAAPASC